MLIHTAGGISMTSIEIGPIGSVNGFNYYTSSCLGWFTQEDFVVAISVILHVFPLVSMGLLKSHYFRFYLGVIHKLSNMPNAENDITFLITVSTGCIM